MHASSVLAIRSRSRLGAAAILLALALVAAGATGASAQFRTPTDTLFVGARSSAEEGYLGFLNLNRDFMGPRALGMGGAGLAVRGGIEYSAMNPAALVDVSTWELMSEFAFLSGSGSVSSFPARLDVGAEQALEASQYRVSPGFRSDYKSLNLGIPLVLFGGRGALGFSYRRMSPNFQGDETRFEVTGPITNNLPATTGLDQTPTGGHDAISFGVARTFGEAFDLGFNLNFQSGEIERNIDIGASVFGQQVTGGGTSFKQDIEGFNIDLGGRFHAGPLSLGGIAYLGHDLTFKRTRAKIFPLPDIQDPNAPVFLVNAQLVEHELSVPTVLGLGASYQVSDRMTVAADYWIRPWSNAEITRANLEPIFFFSDVEDSSTFTYAGEGVLAGDETFSAGLNDANGFRVGLEYLLKDSPDFSMPFRAGFRAETLARNNVDIPAPYDDYQGLVYDYWQYNVQGRPVPEGVDPAQLEADLRNVLEHNYLAFQGDGVDATVISVGIGFRIQNFTIDIGAERMSFDVDRFFFQSFDPLFNPFASKTEEGRSITSLSFSTRMTF